MQDPILFWNNVALEANRLDHTGAMEAEHQRGPTLILVRFQDETNCGRVLAWHDHAGLIRSS